MNRKLIAVPVVAVALLAGCGNNNSAANRDSAKSNDILDLYQKNQPIPQAPYSQFRQTVIDVENAQIHGVATTTFFYNQGVAQPDSCPSLGFPVPSTAQLTNPQTMVGNDKGNTTIAQLEPNGVYTGDSSGTYVTCVAPNGAKYYQYWEGYVKAIGAPAHWDKASQSIVIDGESTVSVTAPK